MPSLRLGPSGQLDVRDRDGDPEQTQDQDREPVFHRKSYLQQGVAQGFSEGPDRITGRFGCQRVIWIGSWSNKPNDINEL